MNTDLSIALSVAAKPIRQIVADLGLQPDEARLNGTTKAKVLALLIGGSQEQRQWIIDWSDSDYANALL